jgi:hypothetical protein
MRIDGDQISRRTGALSRSDLKAVQNGEIVLGLVDGIGRVRRGRPAEPSGGRCLGSSCELGKVGQQTLRSPYGFKGVERGDTWSRLVEVETGIGETDSALGRTGCKCHSETLGFEPALIRYETPADLLANGIEQDRLLDDLAREHFLGKARHEYGFEA